jgi:putative endonuclease
MSDYRLRLGHDGEEIAKNFLVKSGYVIVARNYRCKLGEIDIIARDGDFHVFIEVKTRSNSTYGSPAAAVTPRKQRQICKTAQYYLAEHKLFETPARFDVVAIVIENDGQHLVEVIADAFDLCE